MTKHNSKNSEKYTTFFFILWKNLNTVSKRFLKNGECFAIFEIPFVVEITMAMEAKFQTGYIEFDQLEDKYDQPSLTYIFINTCILDTKYLVFHNHVCITYYSLFGNIHICKVVFKNEKNQQKEPDYCFEYIF